ncbi:MAG: hypothetical protein ACPG6B_04510 [Oceanihabitans sp.]
MKTTYILILSLFVSISTFSQKLDKEKIKALKIAHLTEQLNLTEKEAEVFWPIYNKKEAKEQELREKSYNKKKENKIEGLTETEAKKLLLDMLAIEKQKQELETNFVNNLLNVISAKKTVILYQAERSFRRKMIEQYKLRHKKITKNSY